VWDIRIVKYGGAETLKSQEDTPVEEVIQFGSE